MVNGDTVTSVTLTCAGAAGTATVAGSPYTIVPSAPAGTGLGNYTINYQNGSLTVSPAALDITANSTNKTYGQTVTLAGTAFTVGAGDLVNGDTVTSVTLTCGATAATATVTGSPYSIVPNAPLGTGLSNYTIHYHNGLLTVSPAALEITANSSSKTYGKTLTFAGTEFTTGAGELVNGDTVTSVTLTCAGAAAAAAVGSYPIVPSAAVCTGLGNYAISYHNGSLTVAWAASATPATVLGKTTNLSVLGAGEGVAAKLSYTWALTGTLPAAVRFSVNGSNAAKNTTATFGEAGTYNFTVTIKDAGVLAATSSVSVTVDQTLTAIKVSPSTASLSTGLTQQFSGTGIDQFGFALATQKQPVFAWSKTAGTINAGGLLTAPNSSVSNGTVTASSGAVKGTATFTVTTIQPPTNVATTYVVNAVQVTWTRSANASAYEVYRSTCNNSGTATKINPSDVTGASYNDKSAVAGTTYWYWIRAMGTSRLLSSASAGASAIGGFPCTAYVAKVEGLPNNYPNAYQWGVSYRQGGVSHLPYLQQNGFTKESAPTVGAVIVFQPNAGHGVNTTNGHVGVVHAVVPVTSSAGVVTGWKVTVRGANQGLGSLPGNSYITDAGCPNVSDIVFTIGKSETLISYWVSSTAGSGAAAHDAAMMAVLADSSADTADTGSQKRLSASDLWLFDEV